MRPLILTGVNDIYGEGNSGANQITGNAGDNWLDGFAGADTMAGAAGDDTYIVDNAGDVVTESTNGGTDSVRTLLAAYTLGANLENLQLYTTSGPDSVARNEPGTHWRTRSLGLAASTC